MTISGWTLRRIVDPVVEPIDVADARRQCLIDADITIHDTTLANYIRAARELAESYTKRTFVESSWRLSAAAFPYKCETDFLDPWISIPMPPLIAIESVSYLDTDGSRIYLTAEQYQVWMDEEPPCLIPPYRQTWPSGRVDANAVQIEYRAGYADGGSPMGAAKVPETAKQAIRLMVAHWFNNREDTAIANLATIPNGFERLLDSIRIYP